MKHPKAGCQSELVEDSRVEAHPPYFDTLSMTPLLTRHCEERSNPLLAKPPYTVCDCFVPRNDVFTEFS